MNSCRCKAGTRKSPRCPEVTEFFQTVGPGPRIRILPCLRRRAKVPEAGDSLANGSSWRFSRAGDGIRQPGFIAIELLIDPDPDCGASSVVHLLVGGMRVQVVRFRDVLLGGVVAEYPVAVADRQRRKRGRPNITERSTDQVGRVERADNQRDVIVVVRQFLAIGECYR